MVRAAGLNRIRVWRIEAIAAVLLFSMVNHRGNAYKHSTERKDVKGGACGAYVSNKLLNTGCVIIRKDPLPAACGGCQRDNAPWPYLFGAATNSVKRVNLPGKTELQGYQGYLHLGIHQQFFHGAKSSRR